MRIIAGRFHGQSLKSPAGEKSRPTLSRIREALFNILAPRIAEARFLDLYAGAGGIGLEAMSRGAAKTVFVEQDRGIGRVLADNLRKLDPQGIAGRALAGEAVAMAESLAKAGEQFDIIFLDPPYRKNIAADWEGRGALARLLAPGGIVVFQHDRRDVLPESWAGLTQTRQKKYGETVLSFYQLMTAVNTNQRVHHGDAEDTEV